MTTLRTVCPHDCPDTCSIVATVENGRVTKCDGDPAHPFTQGFLCHKVSCYDERIYSPRRVMHPMVRRSKGGALERVSWDEALDVVVRRLGSGESVLPFSYGGNMGLVARSAGHAFFNRLGAANLKRTICDDAADAAWKSMAGRTIGTDPERAAESDLIVIWGMNASVVNIHWMPFVRQAQKRGAKVVVVDPYRNETAKMADEHIIVAPGTDAKLALGMARVIIDEGLADEDWLAEYSDGFARFKASLRDVEPANPDLARRLAAVKAPFIRFGIGFSRHANGGQAVRSVLALAATIGAFRRGGAVFETFDAFDVDQDVLRRPDLLPHPVRDVNMVQLGDALTADDRIKSLFVYQCNPAAVCPDQMAVRRGLSRADLFVVVHEQMFTDTTDFADVVLPACTSFEVSDLHRSYGHYYLQRSKPVIAPVGESKSNVDLFRALAKRFGFTEPIFETSEDERIELLLKSRKGALADIDLNALNRGEPVRIGIPRGDVFERGFPTASGRFEFGEPPRYVPCPEGCESDLRRRFLLQLLAPPAKHFLNSTFGSVPSLVARQKRPTVLLGPEESSSRGLRDGELARVFNDRGSIQAYVVVTDDIPPGLAVVPSVWWSKDSPGGVSANALTSQRLTDIGEASTFHCALVEVTRADRATTAPRA